MAKYILHTSKCIYKDGKWYNKNGEVIIDNTQDSNESNSDKSSFKFTFKDFVSELKGDKKEKVSKSLKQARKIIEKTEKFLEDLEGLSEELEDILDESEDDDKDK